MRSPCIKQCKLVDDVCTGCRRTKEEITNWTKYTDEQRSKIIGRLSTVHTQITLRQVLT
jgi:predicted Fe-S protein YdhL (DUF1289 family)